MDNFGTVDADGEAVEQVSETKALWKRCREALRQQVSEAVWMNTFADLVPGPSGPDELVLLAPSSFVRDRVEQRFLMVVRDVVDDCGRPDLSLRIELRPADEPAGPTEAGLAERLAVDEARNAAEREHNESPGGQSSKPQRRAPGEPTPLNPSYTFDNFVIGENNKFPHAAARSVAETPARSWNPLFIHGGAGLGKTHLLHGIGNYVREQYPAYRVVYVTTEAFLNEYVEMIRTSSGPAFRRRYRDVDVLLIDDIQFLAGKEGLQEEFFHTFNHLYQSSSQIVLTCDTDPKQIPTLDVRLRTRLLQGLVADVQPPNLETRLAILRKRAERDGAMVPEEVLTLIAAGVKDNIRELEGALTRVIAYSSLAKVELSVETAQSVLSDVLSGNEPRRITPTLILETTAKLFGFTVEELISENRTRPLVTARQIGMYAFRELTDFSFPTIAKEFGGRDHTTVIHAVRKIEKQMGERQMVYDQVTELLTAIRGGGA